MIVALHGNLGEPADWAPVHKDLPRPSFDCVPLWERIPIAPFRDWAARMNDLEEVTNTTPVLLGYSLGGRLAMHMLLDDPRLWNAAIFISAHPGLSDPAAREARLIEDQAWARKMRNEGPIAFRQAWNAQPALAGSPVPPRQEAILREHAEAIAVSFETWSLGLQEDLREPLAACPVPQLWIVGERDEKFRALAEDAVARIPAAQWAVIPEGEHRLLLHRPHEVADCIRSFLAGLKIIERPCGPKPPNSPT